MLIGTKSLVLRFEENSVDYIINYFLSEAEVIYRRGGALTSRQKMKVFLRYLSDPGFQSGVSLDFGVHRTTVSKTFDFVLNKINEESHDGIHFPQSNYYFEVEKQKWNYVYKIPSVIGAIDCTHLEIKNQITLETVI